MSITTPAHVPTLESHARDEVGDQLQATLVELVDLSLIGKQLHWSVTGPNFRSVHLQLDELVDSWRELSDVVAERAVTLGYWPDGQADAVSGASGLRGVDRGSISDHDVIAAIVRDLAESCERIRGRMDRLGELDVASQDVLTEVVRALEEQLWMTRTQLA
jgi:starvation-inducible DNA-binding protein